MKTEEELQATVLVARALVWDAERRLELLRWDEEKKRGRLLQELYSLKDVYNAATRALHDAQAERFRQEYEIQKIMES